MLENGIAWEWFQRNRFSQFNPFYHTRHAGPTQLLKPNTLGPIDSFQLPFPILLSLSAMASSNSKQLSMAVVSCSDGGQRAVERNCSFVW